MSNNPFNGTEYIVEQKILAIRDTFGIKDRNGNLLAYGKKRLVSWGPQIWFESPDCVVGQQPERYGEVHGKVLAVRPTFEIYDSQGQLMGTVRKKILKFLGSEWWLTNNLGVEVARIKGNLIEHDFTVYSTDGTAIAQIHKKWVTVRDAYCIEVFNVPFLSPYLIVAYCVALDHTEYKKPKSGLLNLVVR